MFVVFFVPQEAVKVIHKNVDNPVGNSHGWKFGGCRG